MRTKWLVGLIAFTCAAALAATPAPPADSQPETSPQELLDRLQSLEKEILELQRGWSGKENLPGAEAQLQVLSAKVQQLEQEVAKLRTELDASRQQVEDAWATLDANAEAERARSHLTVYSTLRFENFRGADSLFDAESFELVLSGRPHERLGYFAELEFERGAAVGSERGGEVLVEQAYGTYRLFPWLDFRAGVLLVPFGNYGIDHYAPNREVISKPLVSYLLAPSDWTDNGAGFEGTFSLGGEWLMSYEAYLVAGLDDAISAAGTRASRQPFGVDNNNNKALATHWSLQRGSSLQLGASLYRGKYDDAARYLLTGWALDFQSSLGPLRWTGELDRFSVERPSGPDGAFDGYYVRAVYALPRRWLAHGWHGKSFPDARLAAVVQLEEVRIDDPWTRPQGTNRERRTTLGLSYRPTHQWVLKLNHEHTTGEGTPLTRGNADGWLASVGFVF